LPAQVIFFFRRRLLSALAVRALVRDYLAVAFFLFDDAFAKANTSTWAGEGHPAP